MPRLRRIKDYEVDWRADAQEEESINATNPDNRTNIYEESAEGSRVSGQSWLSNASIIASMSVLLRV